MSSDWIRRWISLYFSLIVLCSNPVGGNVILFFTWSSYCRWYVKFPCLWAVMIPKYKFQMAWWLVQHWLYYTFGLLSKSIDIMWYQWMKRLSIRSKWSVKPFPSVFEIVIAGRAGWCKIPKNHHNLNCPFHICTNWISTGFKFSSKLLKQIHRLSTRNSYRGKAVSPMILFTNKSLLEFEC